MAAPSADGAVARGAAPLTISVDLRAMPKAAFERLRLLSLQRKLLVRLTQAGFAVVGPQLPAQLKIRLQLSGAALAFRMVGGKKPYRRTIPRVQGTIEQYHLEVMHKILTASRQLRPKLQASLPPPTKVRPNRWRGELDLGGALHYRFQGADFLARAGFRWGQERGLGLLVNGFLSPSTHDAIDVYEWGLQLGASWRQPIHQALSLEFGATLGGVHHIYYLRSQDLTRGDQGDFLASFLFSFNWHINPRVGLRLWSQLGISFQSRIHRLNGAVIWERSLLRLELGASIFLAL